jgi:hypothetical protein
MKKVVVVGAVLGVLGVVGLSQPAGAGDVANWTLNCEGGSVTSGAKCDLKNQKSGSCLVGDHNMGQTDWSFRPCGSHNMELVSKSGGAIKCGEVVALKLGEEFYRKCVNPQTVGINVCSEKSSAPEEKVQGRSDISHYQWKIVGCPDGQPVPQDQPVVLHNTVRNDSIVYARRPSKVTNTCWANDIKFGECASIRDK